MRSHLAVDINKEAQPNNAIAEFIYCCLSFLRWLNLCWNFPPPPFKKKRPNCNCVWGTFYMAVVSWLALVPLTDMHQITCCSVLARISAGSKKNQLRMYLSCVWYSSKSGKTNSSLCADSVVQWPDLTRYFCRTMESNLGRTSALITASLFSQKMWGLLPVPYCYLLIFWCWQNCRRVVQPGRLGQYSHTTFPA